MELDELFPAGVEGRHDVVGVGVDVVYEEKYDVYEVKLTCRS